MSLPTDVTDCHQRNCRCICQQGVLGGGVGGTSPECLLRAAMCVKLVSAKAPEAVEGYQPEVSVITQWACFFACKYKLRLPNVVGLNAGKCRMLKKGHNSRKN